MGIEIRESYNLNQNYERQIFNLQSQIKNSDLANSSLKVGLTSYKAELKKATRKYKWLKMGLITLPPASLVVGILLGNMIGN